VKSTIQGTSEESFSLRRFVGIPYENLNCWELCVEFYSQLFDINLPFYFTGPVAREDAPEARRLIYSCMEDYIKTDCPEFGDFVLMSVHGVESHIGIYIDSKRLLHTRDSTGSVIDRLDVWSKRISGYYRLRDKGRSC